MKKRATVKLKQEVKQAKFNLDRLQEPLVINRAALKRPPTNFLSDGMVDAASVLCFATGFMTLGYALGHMF